MITLILYALYSSFVSWTAGNCLLCFLKVPQRWIKSLTAHLVAGLCMLCFLAGIWTLMLPTSYDFQHLFAGSLALIYWVIAKPGKTLQAQLEWVRLLSFWLRILLLTVMLILLVMASWYITHPDTLGYHANIVSWIDAYKAIPGLANIQLRLGYQGQWFPLISFLTPHFLQLNAVNILNCTVSIWLLLFIGEKLGTCKDVGQQTAWLFLLAACLACYMQLRLTATSASPDFIAAMLTWWVFFESYYFKNGFRENLLLTFVCITAITIKLSVAFGLLFLGLGAVSLLREKAWGKLGILFLLSLLIVAPFLLRNIITSGHLIFPLPQSGVQQLSWMVPQKKTALDQAYIKAYARGKSEYNEKEIGWINSQQAAIWLPKWWQGLAVADKIVVSLTLLSLVVTGTLCVFKPKQHFNTLYFWLVLFAGLVFWMNAAPDPRFGYAYLIPMISLLFQRLNLHNSSIQILNQILLIVLLSICIGYLGYRFFNFWKTGNLIVPAGIVEPGYRTIRCNGHEFKQPVYDTGCMGLKAPCLQEACEHIRFRGKNIESGFLPRH